MGQANAVSATSIEEQFFSLSFQILKERVERLYSRSVIQWNTSPGALTVLPEFAQHDVEFPFYWRRQRHPATDLHTAGRPLVNATVTTRPLASGGDTDCVLLPSPMFTMVVYVTTPGPVTSSSVVYRLVKTVGRSRHLCKVCTISLLFLFACNL